MARAASRPSVFVGSSTPALLIAEEVKRGLSSVADVVLWDRAFDPGTWLLGGILSRAQQSDFGVFVIHEDDKTWIEGRKYTSVRENVLFEAGVFMGTLGPERTILLWPSDRSATKLRLPTDLEGLLRVVYSMPRPRQAKPNISSALNTIRGQIVSHGPALRSGYNEIAALRQALHERDIEVRKGATEALGAIVQRAAKERRRPWFSVTGVKPLTDAVKARHKDDKIVDVVFWWLLVYGVITFTNADHWTDDDEKWSYEASLPYSTFTERGVVLLNTMSASGRTRGHTATAGGTRPR